MSDVDERSGAQALLRAYFRELDTALSCLPRHRRDQLISEIRQHVDQTVAEQAPKSPSELQNLLDRVGRPADIAEAALAEETAQPPTSPGTLRTVLIAGVTVLVLAGLGTGLALALTSRHTPSAPQAGATTPKPSHTARTSSATAPSTPATTTASTPATTTPSTPATTTPSTPAASSPTATSAGAPDLRAILAPATVPPVSDECTLQVAYDADGNVSPLLCASGGVNTIAWHRLAYGDGTVPAKSELLTLGRYASPEQVYQAICHDYTDIFKTKPVTGSVEQIAKSYYGWQFGVDPLQEFDQLGCPAPS